MEQHIVKGFDRDLDKIKDHINKIAGLVESQLAYAYQSLNERDILIAEKVIERDKKLRRQREKNRHQKKKRTRSDYQ